MEDAATVARLLGREPRGRFEVVLRDEAGEPVVIRNEPLLDDGTPMPTRYWLVGAEACDAESSFPLKFGTCTPARPTCRETSPAAAFTS